MSKWIERLLETEDGRYHYFREGVFMEMTEYVAGALEQYNFQTPEHMEKIDEIIDTLNPGFLMTLQEFLSGEDGLGDVRLDDIAAIINAIDKYARRMNVVKRGINQAKDGNFADPPIYGWRPTGEAPPTDMDFPDPTKIPEPPPPPPPPPMREMNEFTQRIRVKQPPKPKKPFLSNVFINKGSQRITRKEGDPESDE